MIIAIVSPKGGTGKSTVTVNLGTMFAAMGARTLLLDADDQNSSLGFLDRRPKNMPKIKGASLPYHYLRKQAKELSLDHDITLIDCKGAVNEASKAALVVSDFFVIPLGCSAFDLDSTIDFIENVIEEVASFKELAGALLINKNDNTKLTKRILEYLAENVNFPVLDSRLSSTVTYKESLEKGLSVVEYAPKSKAAEEIRKLFTELSGILNLGGKDVGKRLPNNAKKTKRASEQRAT